MEATERDGAYDSAGDSDATRILASDSDSSSDTPDAARPNAVPLARGNPVLAPEVDLSLDADDDDGEAEFEILPTVLPVLRARDESDSDSDDALPIGLSVTSDRAAPRKRKRKRLRRGDDSAEPAKPTVVVKPQPTECTVCYDPCTISGRHRLVSLKCGHVFGKKCIDRWVLERKTCPNCSVAVRKADIRPLFTDHVAVVDNSGLETMAQKFEAEKSRRIQVETELARAKLQLQLAQSEAKKCQDEADRWRRQASDLQCRVASERFTLAVSAGETAATISERKATPTRGLSMSAPTLYSSSQLSQGGGGFLTQSAATTPPRSASAYASQPVSQPVAASSETASARYRELFQYPLQSARVCAISSSCGIVCVGEAFSPTSHGVLKLSAADPRHAVRISTHASAIRDLSISPQDDLALTVAWDGKAVVSSLRSDSVVMQVPLPADRRNAWSCSFSKVDPFVFFCGFQDGMIAQYDMRRQAVAGASVVALYELPVRQPVHSIQLCPMMGGNHEQLIGGTFAGFGVWGSDKLHQHSSAAGTSIAASSFHRALNCCGVSTSQTKRSHLVVTTRSQPPTVSAKHTLFELPTVVTSTASEPVVRSSIEGFRTPQAMSRAAVWETRDGATMVASWDDEHKCVNLWDEASRQVQARLSGSGGPPIVDVQHMIADGDWRRRRALLGVLSPQRLVMHAESG